MKLLILISLLLTSNAFAANLNICSFETSFDVLEAFKMNKIRPLKKVDDFKKLTSVEKQLIQKSIALHNQKRPTMQDAITEFFDISNGKPGFNAGEIVYYNVNGVQVLLVHHYPGDNEYGAFFSLNRNGSFKMAAPIVDGDIECKK
jgi:hypothetical protein